MSDIFTKNGGTTHLRCFLASREATSAFLAVEVFLNKKLLNE